MPITQNIVIVAVIDPGTQALSYLVSNFGDNGQGGTFSGVEDLLKSDLPAVALFHGRVIGQSDFWEYVEGDSAMAVQADASGNVDIYAHDASGQGATRVRRLNANGTAKAPRSVSTKVSQAVLGGASWDVWNDGQGTPYKTKVNEAISYINATYSPSAPLAPVS